jgi:hypothetical protein
MWLSKILYDIFDTKTWKWRQISQSYIMTQWIRIIIVFPQCGVRIISRIIIVFPQCGVRMISRIIIVGNCFFICLSLSIFGNFEKTGSLTNMICSYIIENWQLWEDKISACHDPRMNLQIYIWHMITRNSWATAAEVKIMFWWIQHLSISFLQSTNLKPFSFYLLLMPNMFVCVFHLIIY